jgi:hypothetical protein
MLRLFALLDHVDADRERGHVALQTIRAFFVRLESGRIPKELSMRESDGIDSLWGSNAEAVFAGLA